MIARILICFLFGTLLTINAYAADLAIASGDTGNGQAFLRKQLDQFENETGNTVAIVDMPANSSDQFAQYRLWLAAGNPDIDLFRTDIELAKFLASSQAQKERAIALSVLPTIKELYDDPQIAQAHPLIPLWRPIFETAVPRPSAATGRKYNEGFLIVLKRCSRHAAREWECSR